MTDKAPLDDDKRPSSRPLSLAASGGERLPTPSAPKRIRLATVRDIQREAARVYRGMRKGTIDLSDGTKLAYVLSTVAKLAEIGDLEDRLDAIEESVNREGTP